jgi:hypothetical protein
LCLLQAAPRTCHGEASTGWSWTLSGLRGSPLQRSAEIPCSGLLEQAIGRQSVPALPVSSNMTLEESAILQNLNGVAFERGAVGQAGERRQQLGKRRVAFDAQTRIAVTLDRPDVRIPGATVEKFILGIFLLDAFLHSQGHERPITACPRHVRSAAFSGRKAAEYLVWPVFSRAVLGRAESRLDA